MPVVYLGVLRGDRIEWQGRLRPPDGPVRVEVALPEWSASGEQQQAIRQALEALAAGGRIDAVEWERQRQELESRPSAWKQYLADKQSRESETRVGSEPRSGGSR